jgi:hypothetical protein
MTTVVSMAAPTAVAMTTIFVATLIFPAHRNVNARVRSGQPMSILSNVAGIAGKVGTLWISQAMTVGVSSRVFIKRCRAEPIAE